MFLPSIYWMCIRKRIGERLELSGRKFVGISKKPRLNPWNIQVLLKKCPLWTTKSWPVGSIWHAGFFSLWTWWWKSITIPPCNHCLSHLIFAEFCATFPNKSVREPFGATGSWRNSPAQWSGKSGQDEWWLQGGKVRTPHHCITPGAKNLACCVPWSDSYYCLHQQDQ